MKKAVLLFSLLLCSLFINAQASEGTTITVTINNITSDKGKVIMALHTEETFMKTKGVQSLDSEVQDGKVTLVFKNVTPGKYAILAIHDLNDNKKMDFEPSGMPIESYGMSGNEMLMGPPTFEDAVFEVTDKPIEMSIRF